MEFKVIDDKTQIDLGPGDAGMTIRADETIEVYLPTGSENVPAANPARMITMIGLLFDVENRDLWNELYKRFKTKLRKEGLA